MIVLAEGERSVVLCLEIDRATQRLAAITGKLAAYRGLLETYPDWQLLFVVPTPTRARWLRRMAVAADEQVTARAWVTSIAALQSRHLTAPVAPLGAEAGRATLEDLVADPMRRRTELPVGSEGWLRLLGEGGIEDLDGLFAHQRRSMTKGAS